MRNLLWGIDLGGTKIEGVIFEPSNPLSPVARERIPTEAGKGYKHIIERTAELVELMKQKSGLIPEKIGFGTPGIADPESGLMKNCNTTCLNGKPLRSDLSEKLNCQVKLANDANCFALSESLYGAGTGASSVFGIIMGTGVGGGIVINGKIHAGFQGIAGEWGHNVLIENGDVCYCGKKGCVERVISGPALERYYYEQTEKNLSLIEILQRGEDPAAAEVLARLLAYFGKAVSTVINILDPEVIVLGGGLSNIDKLYEEGPREISKHVFNDRLLTRVVKNKLGDSAGVFGAALLFN